MPTPLHKVPEILAPAGGRAQFFAALNSGADAVYLGLKDFNARARAENFTVGDLRELLPLANSFGMKVLVTVNVLIKDLELSHLVATLSSLEELGVHAIIVQDLAVARIAKRFFPELRLHASTQMAVHNLAGVIQAWRFGFKRVVLARELTALEIKKIRAAVPEEEIELEAFCHGSLCYSYSGLCFFSGASDARSGNRGECAYTCRQPYKILNEPGHGFLFSMLDLDSSNDLGVLVGTGIDTLKIEGRKKDAQYVSTVVKLYRNRLDKLFGRSTLRAGAPPEARDVESAEKLRGDLALSFQRSPTTFFLKGRYYENVIDLDNPTHLGVRVGEIRKVGQDGIQLHTEIPLERFDGLRVVSTAQVFHAKPQHGEKVEGCTLPMLKKYANEAVQFPLRQMRVNQRWAPTAAAGTSVEIEWPAEHPLPKTGDVLYKVRSADLKRRVLRVESPPPDARLRPLSVIDVKVEVTEDESALRIRAVITKLGTALSEASIATEKVASRGGSDLGADIAGALSLFGDQGFQTANIEVEGITNKWFVPRSKLKELKHALAENLSDRYAECIAIRKQAADEELAAASPRPEISDETRISVKIDRLEALQDFGSFLSDHPDFPAAELVFEPKRAFLPSPDPETLVQALMAFSNGRNMPVRLALPTVIRAWDEPHLKSWLTSAAKAGLTRYEVGNIGALQNLHEWELEGPDTDLAGDFTLYTLNTQATRFWGEHDIRMVALSVEDDLENITSHLKRWPWELGIKPQAILFKDTPLFIAEACSLTALHNGCPTAKVCGYRTLEIESPAGEKYFVAHESCKSIVYAKEAFSITHRRQALFDLGVRDFRVDFLTRPYTKEAMTACLNAAWKGEKLAGTHTANFDRSLL